MMGANETERMETEPIGRLLARMCFQTTFSLFVYSLYSITDTYYVANILGSRASAGIGVFSPMMILMGGLTTTVGSGAASVVSRTLGEHDLEKAAKTTANTFLLFWTGALLFTALGLSLLDPLLILLGATGDILPYAREYGRVILLGAVTSTGFSSIIRADGNIRYSTLQWTVPVLVNMILDPLFLYGFHMGIAGAALATVLSQVVSCMTSLYYFLIKRNRPYPIRWNLFRWNPRILREVVMLGSPSLIQHLGQAVLAIILNNLLKYMGGSVALSIYAIVGRIQSMLLTPQSGIVQGVQPIIGYNYGRRLLVRVEKARRTAYRVEMLYGVLITILCLMTAPWLLKIFSKEEAIILGGTTVLRIFSLSYGMKGIPMLTSMYFQAIGRARESMKIAVRAVIIPAGMTVLFGICLGANGLWISIVVSDVLLWLMTIYLHHQSGGYHGK